MEFPYKTASVMRKEFGTLNDGRAVGVWYLANRQGMRAEVLELGGLVHRLVVIGGDLKKHDVVLGAPDLAAYERGEFLAAALRGCGTGADVDAGAGDRVDVGGERPTGRLPMPIMRGCEEGRHLVLRPAETEGSSGRGSACGDICDSGFAGGCPRGPREMHVALTEENELVIGVEVPFAQQEPRGGARDGGACDGGACGGGACGGKPEGPALIATPGVPAMPAVPANRFCRNPYLGFCMPGLYFNLAGQAPGNVLDHAVAVDVGACVDRADCAGYREGKVLADDVLLPECLGGAVAGFDLCLPIDGSETRCRNEGAREGGVQKEGARQVGVREEDSDDRASTPARDDGLVRCATVYCGRSRVYMDLSTDAPAVRLTTFQPKGGVPVEGKARVRYGNHSGFMLAPVFLSDVSDRAADQRERSGLPSATATYRFTADYPEGYHTDSACMDRIL